MLQNDITIFCALIINTNLNFESLLPAYDFQTCGICDAAGGAGGSSNAHPIEMVVDSDAGPGAGTWWQSPSLQLGLDKHFVTITAREVQLSLVPLHVCGKFIGAGELLVAHLAQGLPHHHLFPLLVLATCLAVPDCDLLARKLLATHHTRVDQPALNTRVSLFVKSEAVSSVGGEAAVRETALKLLHFSMTLLVSPQIT